MLILFSAEQLSNWRLVMLPSLIEFGTVVALITHGRLVLGVAALT